MPLDSSLVSGVEKEDRLHNEHEGQLRAGIGSKACHETIVQKVSL